MLKRLIPLWFALTATSALAQNPELTADEIRERLEVSGEVFVMDAAGTKLVGVGATKNTWRGSGKAPLESNWGNSSNAYGKIYLHHVWTVNPDGTIHVLIEEFARQEDDDKRAMKDLLKKDEFLLNSFAPVTWKVLNSKEKNVFVRLTPSLREVRRAVDLADLPISGQNVIISDNQGYLWSDGDGSSFDGLYVGISTHRGTVAMSFKPFEGAAQVGEASDRQIVLTFPDNLKVKLRSDTAFVPAKITAKVYGIYLPEKKTQHPHSTHLSTSSTAEKLLERLK
jgi:hypothetical protein